MHSVHLGSIWSYSVYFVNFSPIRSTLVLFGQFCPLVLFGSFCPLRNYLVNIGPIQSSLPTSILFGLIWSHVIYSIHFGPNLSICSSLVQFAPFWSTSVIFGPPCSYSVHHSIWSIQTTSVHFNSLRYIFVHFCN